jgi:hypothetical protein
MGENFAVGGAVDILARERHAGERSLAGAA